MNKLIDSSNIIRKKVSLEAFFIYWLSFLQPLHSLTFKEIKVLAAFLYKRFELSKGITDEVMLNRVLFSTDIKDEIKASLHISAAYFNVVISKLKKMGAITGNTINKKFIPNLKSNAASYSLILEFELDAIQQEVKPDGEKGSQEA